MFFLDLFTGPLWTCSEFEILNITILISFEIISMKIIWKFIWNLGAFWRISKNRWCFQKTFMGHLWNGSVWRKIEFSEKIVVLSCFSIPKKRRKISLGCFLISKKSKEHFELFFKFERIETKTFLGCFSFWSKKRSFWSFFQLKNVEKHVFVMSFSFDWNNSIWSCFSN